MTDTSTEIISAVTNGVHAIRLNRPAKKNALTRAMYAALVAALAAGERDEAVGAHLILGQPGAFSTGNDIGEFVAMAETGDLGREVISFLGALASLSKPLVVGVDGLAVGIGTTMLLHADLAFASDRSQFRTPFVDLGLVPEAASSLLAPRLMGHVRAFELLCLGAPFDAPTAFHVGLVNRVVPHAELESISAQCAAAIAAKPREAMRLSRALLRRAGGATTEDVIARIGEEARLFGERLASSEARTAFAAFLARK